MDDYHYISIRPVMLESPENCRTLLQLPFTNVAITCQVSRDKVARSGYRNGNETKRNSLHALIA